MTGRILAVDDDEGLREFLRDYLSEAGFDVTVVATGKEFLDQFGTATFDAVVLDLSLPDMDGLELARSVRGSSEVPLIMLTARDNVIDRVVGLELGADDYLGKPFEPRELLARVRAVLRRKTAEGDRVEAAPVPSTDEVDRFDRFDLDYGARTLRVITGGEIELTAAEFDLLTALAQRPHRVLSREQLIDLVYGRGMYPFERSIDTLVMRVREKIEADRRHPHIIKTVRNAGYVFAAPIQKAPRR